MESIIKLMTINSDLDAFSLTWFSVLREPGPCLFVNCNNVTLL